MLLPRITPLGDIDEDELDLLDGGEPGRRRDRPTSAGHPAAAPPPAARPAGRCAGEVGRDRAGSGGCGSPPSSPGCSTRSTPKGSLSPGSATLVPEDFARALADHARFPHHRHRALADHPCRGRRHRSGRPAQSPAPRPGRRLAAPAPLAPVIAAGSTGSVPATAALLAVIAGLPQGAVVLPGLDLAADRGHLGRARGFAPAVRNGSAS